MLRIIKIWLSKYARISPHSSHSLIIIILPFMLCNACELGENGNFLLGSSRFDAEKNEKTSFVRISREIKESQQYRCRMDHSIHSEQPAHTRCVHLRHARVHTSTHLYAWHREFSEHKTTYISMWDVKCRKQSFTSIIAVWQSVQSLHLNSANKQKGSWKKTPTIHFDCGKFLLWKLWKKYYEFVVPDKSKQRFSATIWPKTIFRSFFLQTETGSGLYLTSIFWSDSHILVIFRVLRRVLQKWEISSSDKSFRF